MPKNTTKDKLKQDLLEDELTQVDIARKYGVSQPYVSQIRIEVERDRLFSYLKFMYKTMNDLMTWKQKPPQDIINKIKEVQTFL